MSAAIAARPASPAGKYLVKAYVDREGRLAKDWTTSLGATALGDADFVGRWEVQARWREGPGAMTVVNTTAKRPQTSAGGAP